MFTLVSGFGHGIAAERSGVAAATPTPLSPVWLLEWFSMHGFDGVPVADVDPRLLALSVAGEFDAWCELNGITSRVQSRARAIAAARLPAESGRQMCASVRAVATDISAWHALRSEQLRLAS
jgi:hypothetical protein